MGEPLSDAAHLQAHSVPDDSEDLTSGVIAAFTGVTSSYRSSISSSAVGQEHSQPRPMVHRRSSSSSLARPALGGNHGSPFPGSKPSRRLLPPVPAYDTTEAALMPHLYLPHADSYDDHQGGDAEEGRAKPSYADTGFERIQTTGEQSPTGKVGEPSDQSNQHMNVC